MEKSPPLEDVPHDTPETIQSLIKDGWIVDVHRRPSASQLLTHPAFQLPGKKIKNSLLQQNFGKLISNFGIFNFRFYRIMVNGPATINANKCICLFRTSDRAINAGPLRFEVYNEVLLYVAKDFS